MQISERNPNPNFISITVNFRIGHRHAVRLYRGWVGGLTCNLLYNSNPEGGFDFVNGVDLPAPTCALGHLKNFLACSGPPVLEIPE